MVIKQILAIVQHRAAADNVIRMAIGVAERFEAMVVCAYVIPTADGPRYAGGLTLSAVMKETAERDLAEAGKVRSIFERIAKQHGISTEWRVATGMPLEESVLQARYSDLIVMSRPGLARLRECTPVSPDDIVHTVGCPMLVVPQQAYFSASMHRAVVAWNSSREAKRAIDDALPILKAADAVDVVLVNPGRGHEGAGGHGQEPGADIAFHLLRHGIRPEIHVDHTSEMSVGARLLFWVERLRADLIVAGAFGYSRLREALIGGVTQHLLDNANVPVFMSR